MNARRLPNGNLLIPKRAEGHGIIGDGMVEIGPSDPEWEEWDLWLRKWEQKRPKTPQDPPQTDGGESDVVGGL